jgi:hypothetical protein
MALGEKETFNGVNVRSNINFKVSDNLNAFIDIAGRYNINQSSRADFWSDASTLSIQYPISIRPSLTPQLITNLSTIFQIHILSGSGSFIRRYRYIQK